MSLDIETTQTKIEGNVIMANKKTTQKSTKKTKAKKQNKKTLQASNSLNREVLEFIFSKNNGETIDLLSQYARDDYDEEMSLMFDAQGNLLSDLSDDVDLEKLEAFRDMLDDYIDEQRNNTNHKKQSLYEDPDILEFARVNHLSDQELDDLMNEIEDIDEEQFLKSLAKICHMSEEEMFKFMYGHPHISEEELYETLIKKSGLSDYEFYKQLTLETNDEKGLEEFRYYEQMAEDLNMDINEMMDLLHNPDLDEQEVIEKLAKEADMDEFELFKRYFFEEEQWTHEYQIFSEIAQLCNMSSDELLRLLYENPPVSEDDITELLMEKSGLSQEEIFKHLASALFNVPQGVFDLNGRLREAHENGQDYEGDSIEELAQAVGVSREKFIEEYGKTGNPEDMDMEEFIDFLSRFSK